MKIIMYLAGFFPLCMLTPILTAQQGERSGIVEERFEAQHVAFITQRLDLTPEESARFWPIYNEYREREKAIRAESKPDTRIAHLSDEEADAMIERHLEAEQRILNLKREYTRKMREAIPPRKIAMLRPAEEAFKRQILQRLRDHRMNSKIRRN